MHRWRQTTYGVKARKRIPMPQRWPCVRRQYRGAGPRSIKAPQWFSLPSPREKGPFPMLLPLRAGWISWASLTHTPSWGDADCDAEALVRDWDTIGEDLRTTMAASREECSREGQPTPTSRGSQGPEPPATGPNWPRQYPGQSPDRGQGPELAVPGAESVSVQPQSVMRNRGRETASICLMPLP